MSCFESAANWLLGNTRSVLTVTLKHPPTNKKGKHEMSIQLYILTVHPEDLSLIGQGFTYMCNCVDSAMSGSS